LWEYIKGVKKDATFCFEGNVYDEGWFKNFKNLLSVGSSALATGFIDY